MRLLVFGKTGQVGQALARLDGLGGVTVISLGRDSADLRSPEACGAVVRERAKDVDAVINAAAYTAVDRAESEAGLAQVINGEAPGAMARAAAECDLPFLHISTDYVFAGDGTQRWQPEGPVAPQNVYGRSKLAGEQAVQAAGGQFAILRTSWVFSAHGSNFVKTMLRLAQSHDQVSVVDDQIGGPTPAAAIAAALTTMARAMVADKPATPRAGSRGGVYHFAGQPDISWAGFAREIFEQSGLAVTVSGIATSEYPTAAERPLNSRLDCARLATDFAITPPDWKAGLADVLQELRLR